MNSYVSSGWIAMTYGKHPQGPNPAGVELNLSHKAIDSGYRLHRLQHLAASLRVVPLASKYLSRLLQVPTTFQKAAGVTEGERGTIATKRAICPRLGNPLKIRRKMY